MDFFTVVSALAAPLLGIAAAVVSFYFGSRAKALTVEVRAADLALSVADLALGEEVLEEAQEHPFKPAAVEARKQQATAAHATRADVARQRDQSLMIAVIAAVGVVVAAVVTPLITGVFSRPAIACPEQIEKVITIVSLHPEAWVPLSSDDPYQEACKLNQVVEQMKAATTD